MQICANILQRHPSPPPPPPPPPPAQSKFDLSVLTQIGIQQSDSGHVTIVDHPPPDDDSSAKFRELVKLGESGHPLIRGGMVNIIKCELSQQDSAAGAKL